jgi:MoaA/NifB/PqqE/SkfB family radical SAM enzyme
MSFGVDIEPTNRCNAKCYFCPRDATPHQGLMTPDVFEQSLQRCVDLRGQLRTMDREDLRISLCGLGEPLLNKHTPSFVKRVRDEGFHCTMSSNAAILDEGRSNALLEAGLQGICINVGDRDADYEEIYKLPFEKTRENILRFRDLAEGTDCDIYIVLVDHRRDPDHLTEMRKYWADLGLNAFIEYEIINRGGALFVDHMQFDTFAQLAEAKTILAERNLEPVCATPFSYLFIGFDGQYYLCCSDWKKEVPLGSVFDTSFVDVMHEKLRHVRTRQPVCETCNLDPWNRLTEVLHARDAGEADPDAVEAVIAKIRNQTEFSLAEVQALTGIAPPPVASYATSSPQPRTTIPVTAI